MERVPTYTFIGETTEYVKAKDIPGINPRTIIGKFKISEEDYRYACDVLDFELIEIKKEDPEAELVITEQCYLAIEKLLSLRSRNQEEEIIYVYSDSSEEVSQSSSDESYIPSDPEEGDLEYDSNAESLSESDSGSDTDWEPPISKRKTRIDDKKGIATKKTVVPKSIPGSPIKNPTSYTRKRDHGFVRSIEHRPSRVLLDEEDQETITDDIDILDKITIEGPPEFPMTHIDLRPKRKARNPKERILLLEKELQNARIDPNLEDIEGLFRGISLIRR